MNKYKVATIVLTVIVLIQTVLILFILYKPKESNNIDTKDQNNATTKVTITPSVTATIDQNLQNQEFLNTTGKYKITVPKKLARI